MTRLKVLPIGGVNIDKSFVIKAQNNPDEVAIIRAAVSLAHRLDLEVVAEGVEDEPA